MDPPPIPVSRRVLMSSLAVAGTAITSGCGYVIDVLAGDETTTTTTTRTTTTTTEPTTTTTTTTEEPTTTTTETTTETTTQTTTETPNTGYGMDGYGEGPYGGVGA